MEPEAEVFQFIRHEFTKEKESGFSRLKRVPDTYVLKFLDYFGSLESQDQLALEDALAVRSLHYFFPPSDTEPFNPTWNAIPAFQQYMQAMVLMGDWKYWGAHDLKRVASPNLHKIRGMSMEVPEEIVQLGSTLRPVKAGELRKRIKSAFTHLYSATLTNHGGGVWLYEGCLGSSELAVEIDYGGRGHQLRYAVTVETCCRPIVLRRLSFESLLGAGSGWWNYITEDNLDQSISVLGEFVSYLAELPSRLPASYLQSQAGNLE
jgi:hypothetical protein